jgi:hypothetical protein
MKMEAGRNRKNHRNVRAPVKNFTAASVVGFNVNDVVYIAEEEFSCVSEQEWQPDICTRRKSKNVIRNWYRPLMKCVDS